MSLYQKYRPHKFEDVLGRDFIIKCLKNSIKNDNLNHAYIFYGTRGTGKTTIARILARAVNCLSEDLAKSPCLECQNCKLFEEGKTPDIIEMDAASNRGIDDIRDIIDHSKYLPHHGKFKVYIVDEVHMLTKEAFNALLKTLEEPPSHIIFILATTEVNKVPETILSRCERYDFSKLEKSDLIERLDFIAKAEDIKTESDALDLIADRASGGMRDAIMLFEQFIDENKTVLKSSIEKSLGLLNDSALSSLINAIIKSDYLAFTKILDDLNKQYININVVIEQVSPILLDRMKSNIESSSEFKKYYSLLIALDDIYKKIKYTSSPMLIFEGVLLNELYKNGDAINSSNLEHNVKSKNLNSGINSSGNSISNETPGMDVSTENSANLEKNNLENKINTNNTDNKSNIKSSDETNTKTNKIEIIDIIDIDEENNNTENDISENESDIKTENIVKNLEENRINNTENISQEGSSSGFDKAIFIKKVKETKGGGLASMALGQSDIGISGNVINISAKNDFQKSNLVKALEIMKQASADLGLNLEINIL